ncbi:serine hydrolase domain-containing protein [Prosthecobacter fusiformis]|nr:serine hydrolase domain-containing protein [Prosthecobacter fusiformis]
MISRFRFLLAVFALAAGTTFLSAEKPVMSVTAALQPYVEKQELAGAVTLAANLEKVLDVSTVGYADVEAKTPMEQDDLFWIASMTKPMTATAVMMLVDEGKIKLDDAVEKYLPEFKGQKLAILEDGKQVGTKAPARVITVRDVLSHTSGLPFKAPEEEPTLDALPLEKAVKTYAAQALLFEPGRDFLYSNAGINTAARILEVVSGMAYEDFMNKRLFEPLGMMDTTFWPNESQVARLAKAYQPGADKKGLVSMLVSQLHYPLGDRAKRFPMPAGGLFSTAKDVGVFGQMILNGGEWNGHRYISKESLEAMTSRQTPAAVARSYGLGWAVDSDSVGHGGAFATNLSVDKKHGLVLVYLVQHSGFPGEGKKALGAFKSRAIKAFAK